MVRAAVYCRISDDRAGSGLGVKRQEKDSRALVDARGWEVAEVYVDNDVSAYSGRRRPAYERMLADIERGEINAVVAWHPDRLHRSPKELEYFIDVIESAKAKVATVQGGEYDLSTASGRMTARVVGAVARGESEHKSERQARKALELAQAGKVGGGGTRPYGFEADRLTIVKAEAKVIRELSRRIRGGETLRGVATHLNDKGVTTVTGRPWTTVVLRRMLTSPRIAGLREHRGEIAGEAEWPAIITRAEHEQLVAILKDPARRTHRPSKRYLLTGGLAVCGVCESKLVARPRDDKRRCYVCASGVNFGGCGGIRILAGEPGDHPDPAEDPDGLEDLVVKALFVAVDSPKLAAKLKRKRPVAEHEDTADLERKLDELATAWGNDEIDRRSWLAARKTVEKRLAVARRHQATVSDSSPLLEFVGKPGALRAAWPSKSIDERRAIIAAAIDRVTVNRAVWGRNRFDAERVDVDWRY